jgi:hypothetical protein
MKSLLKSTLVALALLAGATLAHAQTWNLQVVDDAGDTGYDSQTVVAGDGTPYIFYKANGNMYVAWWVPGGGGQGGWQYATLETNSIPTGGYPWEVLVDSQGRFQMAYARTNGVRYGIWNPTSKAWVLGPETVTGAAAYTNVDMTLTTIGADIIPVLSINADGNKVSIYKRDPGTGAWSSSLVDNLHNATRPSSIALDSTRKMHVCFYEPSGQNLMYATKTWDDTVWQVSTVDIPGNVGDYCSIAVTPDDHVHIVYYDTTNGDLKYAALNP